jgi:hypothetical protein
MANKDLERPNPFYELPDTNKGNIQINGQVLLDFALETTPRR